MVQVEQQGTRSAFRGAPVRSNISLDALIQVWAERGAALPTAVVGAVFCDLLTADPEKRRSPRGAFSPTLRDVHILADGRAWLDRQRFATDVHALGRLLVKAIADGPEGEHQIPPQAFGLCANLMSRDPHERPSDPEQLCDWMRRFLGPPAQQDEVRAVVDAVRSFQQNPPPPSALPSELSEVVASERPPMETQESALSALAASMVPGSNDTDIDPSSAAPSPITDEELDTLLPAPVLETAEEASVRSGGSGRPVQGDVVQIDISNRSLVAMATSEIETPLPVEEVEPPPEQAQLPAPSDQTAYPEPLDMVESPSSYGGFDPPLSKLPESEPAMELSACEAPSEAPPVVELAEAMSGYVELDEDASLDATKKRPPPSARPQITDSVLPHPAPSTRVKVQAAPAARRSARPTVEGADSLLLPSERGAGIGIWIGVILVIAAVVYFYVF